MVANELDLEMWSKGPSLSAVGVKAERHGFFLSTVLCTACNCNDESAPPLLNSSTEMPRDYEVLKKSTAKVARADELHEL